MYNLALILAVGAFFLCTNSISANDNKPRSYPNEITVTQNYFSITELWFEKFQPLFAPAPPKKIGVEVECNSPTPFVDYKIQLSLTDDLQVETRAEIVTTPEVYIKYTTPQDRILFQSGKISGSVRVTHNAVQIKDSPKGEFRYYVTIDTAEEIHSMHANFARIRKNIFSCFCQVNPKTRQIILISKP